MGNRDRALVLNNIRTLAYHSNQTVLNAHKVGNRRNMLKYACIINNIYTKTKKNKNKNTPLKFEHYNFGGK